MDSFKSAILATVVYYDILDVSLTLFEVHKFLVNPGRLSKIPIAEPITLGHIDEELQTLVKLGTIQTKNGFYFLPGRERLYDIRIGREKISAAKWKKFLKTSRWFQAVPYLRGMLASGSMALGNTDEDSDFDVLVIAASGRLYTCRVFLSLTASLFRARRKRFDKTAPDKFCFNHYITDTSLPIRHESLYNAQTYIHLKPVLIGGELFEDFYASNIWLNKYVYNFKPANMFVRRSVKPSVFLRSAAVLGEFFLNNKLGDLLEGFLKKYQQRRIRSNPVTYEKGGRVVFNGGELEFHPHSFERIVVDRYNVGLIKLGIPGIVEKDSGLS
ncbi:MAG: hypothetical protein HYT67_00190 [Candidatus Yanofskybacteria bacterium]|nr:hypothetical protein [Candidatus Yanofskybacteria bacterium]